MSDQLCSNITFIGNSIIVLIRVFVESEQSSYIKHACFFFPPFEQFMKNKKILQKTLKPSILEKFVEIEGLFDVKVAINKQVKINSR
jgi:hypothetical protein